MKKLARTLIQHGHAKPTPGCAKTPDIVIGLRRIASILAAHANAPPDTRKPEK